MQTSTVGPIAKKIVDSINKLKRQKVVDLASWRRGFEEMQRVCREATPPDELGVRSPVFAAYTYVTNWALGLVEAIQVMPELHRFVERIQQAEEEYMPSGPPMSPLTKSYFWSWALWDMTVGVRRETLGSILLAIMGSQNMDPLFVSILAKLVDSRLGLYVHKGVKDERIQLHELVTDAMYSSICPAGYFGVSGELWLARVLPPPNATASEHVVVTTPYVIMSPDVAAWRKYLDRTLPKTGLAGREPAYVHLMKHGLNERYWSEYVFDAYANHRNEAIFLLGLPDVAKSRPHSRANAHLW